MRHKILKKHLKENSIIPIFLDWNNQKNYRGDAILIKRLQDKEETEEVKEYEFIEIGSDLIDRKKEKVSIIYSYQIWIIKFVSGNYTGFTTRVKIAYYKKTKYGKC